MPKIVARVFSILFVVGACFSSLAFAGYPPATHPAAPAAAPTSDCASKAVSETGKPLAGAAKASFIKKCELAAGGVAVPTANSGCDAKAVSKKGKPLAGAAKASFIKKCEGGQKMAK